jgi:Zn-dependent M28 family amino/carboxypeptidase
MMMKSLLISALLLSSAALAQSEPAFDAQRVARDIETLSSDVFEGRGPATPGEEKTVAYLTQQMAAAGLEPGGDLVGGTRAWTQKVPLLRADIVGQPKLSLDLAGQQVALTQGEQIAVRAAMTGQRAVRIDKAPLVFVGYGVSAPEKKWDDFKGLDLKGKIMVVLVNDPDFETGQGDFGGKAMTYYGRWTYKYEEAARRGAAGVLIVHETAPASYGWATVKSSNTNTMFDIVRANPKAEHPPIEAWIQRDQAEALFKASGLDFEAEKKKAQARDFRPVPLKASLSADYAVDAQVITSFNVVGRLPGALRPEETILYTAHWDHIGVGEPDANGDRIYNGAVDNATGTAQLLELARIFAKGPRPQRSIVFLAVTAEEKGLLGSEYYAANPLYPLGKTVAAINMDGANVLGRTRNISTYGQPELELLDKLVLLGQARGRRFTPDPLLEAGRFYRSDHFPMAKRGVPALSFSGGNDLVDGGTARGDALANEYVRARYHQPDDEWDPSWDLTGLVDDLGLLHALGSDLANSGTWPNWKPGSEFRAARDKSAVARRPRQR